MKALAFQCCAVQFTVEMGKTRYPGSRITHFSQGKGGLVLRLPYGDVNSVLVPDSAGCNRNLKSLLSHYSYESFRAKALKIIVYQMF